MTDRVKALAFLLAAAVLLGTGLTPAVAQGTPVPSDSPRPQVVEGDMAVGPVQRYASDPLSGLVAAWSPASAPFAADPFIAWRDATSVVGSHSWEVWRCDGPGSPGSLAVSTVITNLNAQAIPYFQFLSRGRYAPGFANGGAYAVAQPTNSIGDCLFDDQAPYGWGGQASSGHGFLAVSEAYGLNGIGSPGAVSMRNFGGGTEWELESGTRQAAVGGSSAGYSANQFRQLVTPLVLHEMGHGLGWPHVPIRGAASPYTNPLDVMSGGFGSPFVGTAMINLYGSGWIDPSEVSTWSGAPTEIRIGTLQSSRSKMVIIPTGDSRVFYTVSVQPNSYDSPTPWGVVVHHVDQRDTGQNGYCFSSTCTLISRKVEVLPPSSWTSAQAPLVTPGRSVSEENWQVSIAATHADGFTVKLDTTGFIDTRGHLFESEIDQLAAAGITRGCNPPTNSRFCPNDPVTRGQMAAFLVRALDLPAGSKVFTDTAGHLFQSEIASLEAAGITRGCDPPTNSRFCPNDPVTRGQMAAFLVRAGLAD